MDFASGTLRRPWQSTREDAVTHTLPYVKVLAKNAREMQKNAFSAQIAAGFFLTAVKALTYPVRAWLFLERVEGFLCFHL